MVGFTSCYRCVLAVPLSVTTLVLVNWNVSMGTLVDPVIALFASLGLGYLIGKLRIGPIQLGGVCGTLFVALAIGQLGVRIGPDLKEAAFALFIFALGFSAGPPFFANIRGGWRYGIFSLIEIVCVLLLIALSILIFRLDIGTAVGLFAGAATESAVLGTASEAISHLDLSQTAIVQLQGNMATAYSLTYLFGLVSIVVFTTQLAPLILGTDLRKTTQELARDLGSADDDNDQIEGLPVFVARAFRVGSASGQSVEEFERSRNWAIAVECVLRGSELLETSPDFVLEPADIVIVRGRRNAVIAVQDRLGEEMPVPAGIGFALTSRDVVLTRKEVFGRQIRHLREMAGPELGRGVFISGVRRMGQSIPALSGTILQQGDVVTLYGTDGAVAQASVELGKVLPPGDRTDFMMLGLGVVVGLIIGKLSFKVGALDLTLGSGGGALISGLICGWLNMRNPSRGAFPSAAGEFAKDFGLAAFIAAIGLSAGPDAIALVKQYGLILPALGILVSVLPAFVSLVVGAKLMKIETPILLGVIAGQHCSTPTISALVSKAGSSIPVIGYTVTYAISNVLLPLMGPIAVAMAAELTK